MIKNPVIRIMKLRLMKYCMHWTHLLRSDCYRSVLVTWIQKTALLTPNRKRIENGKSSCLIEQKMCNPNTKRTKRTTHTKKCIVKMLGKVLAQEIITMASDGVHPYCKADRVQSTLRFTWHMLLSVVTRLKQRLHRAGPLCQEQVQSVPNCRCIIHICMLGPRPTGTHVFIDISCSSC